MPQLPRSLQSRLLSAPPVVLLLLLVAGTAAAAPQAELWPRWAEHDPESTRTIDHEPWERFMEEYLITDHPSGVNRVHYGEVTEEHAAALTSYVEELQSVRVSRLNRKEQRAFWLNLYNAYTVKLIVDNYPVESIRDIDISGLFSDGPWDAGIMSVEGVEISLNDIEHRILRPIYQDPLIHYAVNCASIGCPNLQPEPFTADNYRRLAERGARAYVNHPRGVKVDAEPLVVSSIYDWFVADFGGDWSGVVDHLTTYAEPEPARLLRAYEGRVRYHYDWSLNEP